jgi:hypothetical protein
MKEQKMYDAREIAKTFLKRVEAVDEGRQEINAISGSKKISALKRTSMELTRALAEMRKPN